MTRSVYDVLAQDGIADVPGLTLAQAQEFMNYLGKCPTWNGHVKAYSLGKPGTTEPDATSCWEMEHTILAPHFFERALQLTTVAEVYLGQEPVLYSVNCFTTYPGKAAPRIDLQEFHRDRDDVKFVAMFMLCSNINCKEDGAHQFVIGSHLDMTPNFNDVRRVREGDVRPVDGRPVKSVCGPTGTMFLADTWGLHRGIKPMYKPRSIVWARWGVSDPPATYGLDQLTPIKKELLGARYPTDPRLQRIIRLIAS